jgi:glycine/D-amino acid oxidase-like deaminating enzyme
MAASDYRDGTARCRVVVVGAGVAGLAAANSLLASGQFAGHDVVVFEGDRLVEEDEQLHPLVASAPNGRKRLALCVHKMETYMGATADDLQIDDFLEIDLIG